MFAGFSLTSSSYLQWLYHLIQFVEPVQADALTMIGGYTLQAGGLGIVALIGRKRPEVFSRVPFAVVIALHFACAVPAVMGTTFAATLAFGYLMNIMCGMIAAFYLYRLSANAPVNRRGIVFGGGYACSILLSWLLSLGPSFGEPGTFGALVPCLVLSVVAVGIMFVPERTYDDVAVQNVDSNEASKADARESAMPASATDTMRTAITFAVFAVLLMSLVKNVGFSFPTADITAGVNLELSRLFYGVGLVIAGFVIDRSRKYGAICCLAALITPFICMVLADEPMPGMVMWALDYFFYGFFSVFRVVLFADMADECRRPYLAVCGLMVGRIGDALGTAVCLSLGSNTIALVAVAAVLFVTTILVFYRLTQMIFQPQPAPEKTEQELFEEFSARYDLSSREREVMRLLLDEQSNSEIAAELFVSQSTVKFHVRNLLKKTGCKNRQELRATYWS